MSTRFLIKLLAYGLPLGAYLGVAVGGLLYSGEFTPAAEVAQLQDGDAPVLYGRAYSENGFAYKLAAARLRKPEVLILGSSRVLEFRAPFFDRRPSSFYNAGLAAQSVYEAVAFLSDLDQTGWPRVLIIGLDQTWFNARFGGDDSLARPLGQLDEDGQPPLDRALAAGPPFAGDVLSGKVPLPALMARLDPVHGHPALGVNAIVNGNGFRNDGSYQYGQEIVRRRSVQERLASGYRFLRDDLGEFARGQDVSPQALSELGRILGQARRRGVYVVGFSPPFAPTIYGQMMADGQHTYLDKSVSSLEALFRSFGFLYFDCTDASWVGATDDGMLDGFHPTEAVDLNVYMRMLAAEPDVLGRYSDLAALQAVEAAAPSSPFDLFGDRLK